MHSLDQRTMRRRNVLSDAGHNFLFNSERQAESAAEVKQGKAGKPRGSELPPFHVHS
jgi:hypothetical protein